MEDNDKLTGDQTFMVFATGLAFIKAMDDQQPFDEALLDCYNAFIKLLSYVEPDNELDSDEKEDVIYFLRSLSKGYKEAKNSIERRDIVLPRHYNGYLIERAKEVRDDLSRWIDERLREAAVSKTQ